MEPSGASEVMMLGILWGEWSLGARGICLCGCGKNSSEDKQKQKQKQKPVAGQHHYGQWAFSWTRQTIILWWRRSICNALGLG